MSAVPLALTPARARGIDQLAGADGIVCGAAVDHRDSLRAALTGRGLPDPGYAGLVELKLRIVRALAPAATAVLLDAEHGAPHALAAGVLPGTVGLAVPLEAQGYDQVGDGRRTTFLPGWSPAKARRLGACACKLLLPYRPDEERSAAAQDGVVRTAVATCHAEGLPLVLEPIVYRLAAEEPDAFGERFAGLVVRTVERLAPLGADVLKLQHPGSAEGCAAVDRAAAGRPWVLLGGGAEPEAVERQVAEACAAGASGFVVGRTLWAGALSGDAGEGERWLAGVGRPLLERLAGTARRLGTPWRERVPALPPIPEGWYAGEL